MSVPTWKQTASKLDAFSEAVKLRHIITQMILRDFGLKRDKFTALIGQNTRDKYPELKPLIQRIDTYQNEVEKARLLKQYDDDFVKYIRQRLFDHSSELIANIAAANEIQCKIAEEFKKRILIEDDAIGDIAKIRQDVLFVEEFFNIDLSRYMEYSEQLLQFQQQRQQQQQQREQRRRDRPDIVKQGGQDERFRDPPNTER